MSKRACGSCSLCCKVLAVPAVYKPAGQWCRHFRAGAGCEIHQLRPKACREFACLWLTEDWLDDAWKPDVAKFVLAFEYDGACLSVYVDPKIPNAWKVEPYYTVLKRLAERHLTENRVVMIVETARRILVLPDQEVAVGHRDDLFEWEIATTQTPQGPRFAVTFDKVDGSGRSGPLSQPGVWANG